jgi:Xaa-Pro aminopeptidase
MKRIKKLLEYLQKYDVECILIKGGASIRYFSGFSGDSGFLVVSENGIQLLVDSRYTEQAKQQCFNIEIIEFKTDLWSKLKQLLGTKKIGFDGEYFNYNDYENLVKISAMEKLKNISLTALRAIKENCELELIKKAVSISDQAFANLIKQIKVNMTEQELAAILEYEMRKLGSEKVAFETIVASGTRSALPHGIATTKKIEKGDFVTFDFGATYGGYCSDITRTVVIGEAAKWQKELYNIVLNAQKLGCESVKSGMKASELDHIVRKNIEKSGYGKYFGHGLGHGVGLEIHENPFVSGRDSTKLQPNMVITIEPGIYIPGKGGLRIEDTVIVENNKGNVLTSFDKQMLEII